MQAAPRNANCRLDAPPLEVVHRLVEAQARRTPDAAAVVFERRETSYGSLNQTANRLARDLRRRGVGPGGLVGIQMERCPELVIALLSVLKAGAAYVPLDPDYPKDRRDYMIADAGVRWILTIGGSRHVDSPPGVETVCLDADWSRISREAADNDAAVVRGGDLAYVMYTSGSTGRPKGVMLPHAGIYNRLTWMQDAYGLTDGDRVLQKTPYGFDVSVWEFFWPLMAGARLVLARPGAHRDAAALVRIIRDEQITVVHFVPSMLQVFLQAPGVSSCTSLRHVFCSGESLSLGLQHEFFNRLSCELHNLYGPTEASIDVTAWRCRPGTDRVPIGGPIANTRVHVLDANLECVPVGATGELYVGGAGLARGYLGRPGLTAERFVPDPHSAQPGGRLYRTSDVVRRLTDGQLEYVARTDHQVKIRGHRVELGEVEAVLREHPAVRDAVVVAPEDAGGVRHLVAYTVPTAGDAISGAALRRFLAARLPAQMLPSSFVALPALPLGVHGKIDRAALSMPAAVRPELERDCAAPRTPTEAELAALWAEVLRVDQVGVDDDFFDSGGDSLRATQLVSRIAFRMGRELPVRAVFDAPTVSQLAAVVDGTPSWVEGRD
jgi:amino acid adenylation domain-containing protein